MSNMFLFVQDDKNQQCSSNHSEDMKSHGLLLDSGGIDFDVISNTIESFFGENKEARRRGTGKNPINSPMLIKFHE